MGDWHAVLGVDQAASDAEIRRAFRARARETHPDFGGSPEAFMAVHEAFTKLTASDANPNVTSTDPGEGNPDTVSRWFPRRFARQEGWHLGGTRGPDVTAEVMVSQRAAVFGGQTQLRRNRLEPCPQCRGTGEQHGEPCCQRCEGEGRIVHFVIHELVVDERTKSGDELRLVGLGDAGERERDSHGRPVASIGPCGALIIKFRVETSGRIAERGDDLITGVDVGTYDALLGTSLVVELLDGPHHLDIPPGVRAGQRLRIPGRGAPRKGSNGRGDFLVEVRVEPLGRLDQHERNVLEQLRQRRRRADYS